MIVANKPEYVTVVMTNSKPMGPGEKKVDLSGAPSGETAGEIIARCQAGQDSVNWLIDSDGMVYELAGWERATPQNPDAYVVRLVMPVSGEQQQSLTWLLGQLERKKGVSW